MIISPLYVSLPRKRSAGKRIPLNLNVYRNTHYRALNDMKKAYKETVREQIQEIIKVTWPVKLQYRYFLARRADVGNFHSVVEKFFLDALVELGRLPDDDVRYVVGGNYMFAGYDRVKPRCEITLLENYQD